MAERSTCDNELPNGPHTSFVKTLKEVDLWAEEGAKGRGSTRNVGRCWGRNSLDTELGGCGKLTDNLCQWIDKCGR